MKLISNKRMRKSPSGLNEEEETNIRSKYHFYLHNICKKLKLSDEICFESLYYFHIFYCYRSFKNYEPLEMVCACIILSLKNQGDYDGYDYNGRKVKNWIKFFATRVCYNSIKKYGIKRVMRTISYYESELLKCLDFCVLKQPFIIEYYLKNIASFYNIKSRQFTYAHNIMKELYFYTNLFIKYTPKELAATSLYYSDFLYYGNRQVWPDRIKKIADSIRGVFGLSMFS